MTSLPRVSACLITKNETKFLPGCLSSLSGLVDEIVLVDTGSTDDTVAIAERFGCHVLHSPWQDNFSIPRNLGLDNATGDWILYIDADETLACLDGAPISSLLPGDDAVAATVRFHPRHGMTAYFEYRLFRRDPRIRFAGAMHESMLPGILRVCSEDGKRIAEIGKVEIFHHGYEGDQSHKHARNLPLLERAIGDDPLRVYLRFHIGLTLFELGRTDEAIAQLRKGMDNAAHERASPRARIEGSMCAQVLSAALLHVDKTGEALEAIERGREFYPDNKALIWARGRCLVDLGRHREAIATIEPLLAIDPETYFDPYIAHEKSLFREDTLGLAGSAWFALGDYDRACSLFEKAAKCAADPREFIAKAALAQSRAQRSIQG